MAQAHRYDLPVVPEPFSALAVITPVKPPASTPIPSARHSAGFRVEGPPSTLLSLSSNLTLLGFLISTIAISFRDATR